MKIKPATSIIDNTTNTALEIEAEGTSVPRYREINDPSKPSEIGGKKVSYYKSIEYADRTFIDQEAKTPQDTAYTKVNDTISANAGLTIKENKVYNGGEQEYINRLSSNRNFIDSGKRNEADENLEINKDLGLTSESSISAYIDSKTKYKDEQGIEHSLDADYTSEIKSRIIDAGKQPNKTIVNQSLELKPEIIKDSNLAKDEKGFGIDGRNFESAQEFTLTTDDVFGVESSGRFDRIKSNIDSSGAINSNYFGSQDNEPTNNLGTNLAQGLAKSSLSLGIGAGAINKVAGLFGVDNEQTNNLSVSMTSLQHWKEERIKTLHTNDWKGKYNLNRDENADGSMMSNLRGELGRTTGGLSSENPWLNAGAQLLNYTANASNINAIKNITGSVTGESIGDSAWQPDVDELAALNTVTKDTMYTSKPGMRFKAKPEMIQNITSNQESAAIFGNSRYSKNGDSLRNTYGASLDLLRDSQLSATRMSKIRRMILNNDNEFKKKKPTYDLKENVVSGGSLYNYTEISNDFFYWDKSDDLYTNYNLSNEEAQLITLIKNRNTYNKTLGYIYIRPYYGGYALGERRATENGLGVFDIPFEFTPSIQEGATQANYQQETLLGRLGQFNIFTGTNLSTLSVELQYMALAPDELDSQEKQKMNKEWGTDAWQYYWTNNRIEAIEMKLRSLVFADYVTSDYLIKPPLVEIHLENSKGRFDTVGDLYKYPIGDPGGTQVGENYLKYTTAINGSNNNRYKKYIVNSVQIDKISDSDIIYPSLYGRVYDSEASSSNPMYHVRNAISDKPNANANNSAYGFSGYARKKGFKATLSLTEVTENFLDLVPDFKAYFNAWTAKEENADIVSGYAEKVLNANEDNLKKSVKEQLEDALSIAKNTLLSSEDRIDAMFDEYEKLAKLYAKSYTCKDDKKPHFNIGLFNERDGGSIENNKFNFISTSDNKLPLITTAEIDLNDEDDVKEAEAKAKEKQAEVTMTTLLNGLGGDNDGSSTTNVVKNLYSFYTKINYVSKKKDGEETTPITYSEFANNQEMIKFFKASNLREKLYRYGEQAFIDSNGNTINEVKYLDVKDYLNIGDDQKFAWMIDKNGKEKTEYGYIDSAIGFVICKDIVSKITNMATQINTLNDTIDKLKASTNLKINGEIVGGTENSGEGLVDKEYKIIEEVLSRRIKKLEEFAKKENLRFQGKSLEEAIEIIGDKDKTFTRYASSFQDDDLKSLHSLINYVESNKAKLAKLLEPGIGEGIEITPSFTCGGTTFEEVLKVFKAESLKDFINNNNRYSTDIKTILRDFKKNERTRLNNYLEKFDTKKSYLKAVRKNLFYNILTLIGLFSNSKIKGIKADKKNVSKIKVYNLGKISESLSDKEHVSYDDLIFGKESIPEIDAEIKDKDGNVITNPLTFSVTTIDCSVISLKEILEAIIDGYNSCRQLLLDLVDENKDLIGGIPVDNIKSIDLKEKLKEATNVFMKSVTGHGAKLNANGSMSEGTEADSASEGESISPDLVTFFDELKNDLVDGFTTMEKVVFLCEDVFNRDNIKQRMDGLYLEGADGTDNKVKAENISGGSKLAKEAKYKSYGLGDQEEQRAKNNNGNSVFLPCYKTNKGNYLLKKEEFDKRDEAYWKNEAKTSEGHGEIYRQYISQAGARDLASKLDKANGAKTLSAYDKLS